MNTSTPTASPTEFAEFDISGLEALLAGTLCLMSAYSHCQSDSNPQLLRLKIISNLTCLQCQPRMSSEFRQVVSKVIDSWHKHGLMHEQCVDSAESPHKQHPSHSTQVNWHQAPKAIH